MDWIQSIQQLERNIPPRNQIYFQAFKSVPEHRGAQKRAHKMLAGVEDMNVPNLPEEVEITMNDIKREADKECSLKCAESIIKTREIKVRRSTLLKKASTIVNSGWKKGRLFYAHEGNLLMTPTNMTSISWLDLAEYSLNFKKTFRSCRYFPDIFRTISKRPRYEYHLETRDSNFTREFEYYTAHYFKQVDHSIKLEKELSTVVALTRMFDNVRLVRYMNSIDNTVCEYPEFHLRILPRLLVEHCNDSKIIVNYFMIMTYLFPSNFCLGGIVKFMKLPYLHFFIVHTMNVLRIHPQRSHFKRWIIEDLHFVERAVIMGQNEVLELLLGFGWPHECFFSNEFYLYLYGSPAFSHADTISFLLYIISGTNLAEPKMLTHSIRLFWRCLKNPYLSSDDLVKLVQWKRMEDAIKEEFSMPIPDITDPYITSLLSFYPTDCLATYQPRSLLHLSRCKIREIINMMESVNVLPLCNRLKDYLWLKW